LYERITGIDANQDIITKTYPGALSSAFNDTLPRGLHFVYFINTKDGKLR
jgi:hypothetical protein